MSERPLLPQLPTDDRVEVESIEWLFEPDWPGERLVARVTDGAVRLTDAAGSAVDDRPQVGDLLSRTVRAPQATIDGVWTAQPVVAEEQVGHGDGAGERPALVALDLLELDGEPLLDVPFQERRRLLESVVEEGLHVRVGPMVKQPVSGWLAGWRQAGFTHYLARHQNARYRPGERSDDWLRIPLDAPQVPGLMRRIVGGARGGTRRIRD